MKTHDNISPKNHNISRRRFFTRGLGALGGMALAGSMAGCDSNLREGSRTFADKAKAGVPEIDPALLTYREDTRWQLTQPNARNLSLTADNRLLAVGDSGLETVPITADAPAPDVDPQGSVSAYLQTADGKHHFVANRQQVTDYGTGNDPHQWPILATDAFITSLATDGEHLYIADAGSRLIWKFSLEGRLLGKWGEKDKGRNQPGIIVPSPYMAVTVDPQGALWGVNPGRHLIHRYDDEGNVTTSWGRASAAIDGFCGCCNPTHLVALQDGTGFVTCEKGLPRVKIYKPDGTLDCVVASPAEFEAGLESLAIAANSRDAVYVLEPHTNVVHRYVPDTPTA